MFTKIAELTKQAEVNGVLAGLVDSGLIEVDTAEDFDKLAELVAGELDGEYTMEDVMAKTAEVIDALGAVDEDGLDKEAGEFGDIDETALLAAYGELTLLKEAGEISEEEFVKEAGTLSSAANWLESNAGKAADAVKGAAKSVATNANPKTPGVARKLVHDVAKGARGAADYVKGGFKAEKLRAAMKRNKGLESYNATRVAKGHAPKAGSSLAPGLKQLAAAGATVGAAGGTAYGAQKLYDKHKKG